MSLTAFLLPGAVIIDSARDVPGPGNIPARDVAMG